MNLEQENQRLQKTIQKLLQRMEKNHDTQQHFHKFELRLLACQSLADLFDLLLIDAKSHFNLTAVSLILIDPDYALQELLERLELNHYGSRLQLRHGPEFLHSVYPQEPKVELGVVDILTCSRLFPGACGVESAACLPLLRQEKLEGSWHFASDSNQRFMAGMASDYLLHLASVVSMCLENCIGREHLKHQGQVDMLTQVNNRRSFEMGFEKELERAERYQESLSCMFVDVDYFKKINDNYGHQAGDLCLKFIAQEIDAQLRKTDLLARFGGEEFVALLPHCEDVPALAIAERIRQAIESTTFALNSKNKVKVTVSIGVSSWQPSNKRSDNLTALGQSFLACADETMYRAKHQGRNQVLYAKFNPSQASELNNAVAKTYR